MASFDMPRITSY